MYIFEDLCLKDFKWSLNSVRTGGVGIRLPVFKLQTTA